MGSLNMDKMNWLLNIIQLICFVGIIYITWLNHIPSVQIFGVLLLAVIIDVLSGYQSKREAEKKQ